jgi:hypothetical protein
VKALSLVAVLLVGCAAAQRPTALSPDAQRNRRAPGTTREAHPKGGSPEACHSRASEKPFGSEMEEVGGELQQIGEHR